jgi:hypothetical protein
VDGTVESIVPPSEFRLRRRVATIFARRICQRIRHHQAGQPRQLNYESILTAIDQRGRISRSAQAISRLIRLPPS